MASNKGLGKGLGALLGESAMQPVNQQSPLLLPLQKIEPNRLQPRRNFDEEELSALADSIRQHGVIQPLTVRLLDSGYYQIIAGERRWRASRLAGLDEVPVIVREMSDREAAEIALIENLQRRDLHYLEEAAAIARLIATYGLSQEQAAEIAGVTRQSYSKWEQGETVPDIEKCDHLARHYGVTLDALLHDQNRVGHTALAPAPAGKHLWGAVTLSTRGQIVIPKAAREMFD